MKMFKFELLVMVMSVEILVMAMVVKNRTTIFFCPVIQQFSNVSHRFLVIGYSSGKFLSVAFLQSWFQQ